MRRSWFDIFCVLVPAAGLLWVPGRALADTVAAGGREWTGAKIQWIQDGKVRFTAADGAQQAVPIATVSRLEVDLKDDLNRAEQLRTQGKMAEALRFYETARRVENRSDLASYIRYRLMDLYGQTGQLDQAVEMFLDLVKQPDFHGVVAEWRPQTVAAKPKIREAAITALEDGIKQIRTGLASESVRRLRDHIQAASVVQAPGQPSAAPAAGSASPGTSTPSGAAGQVPPAAQRPAGAESRQVEVPDDSLASRGRQWLAKGNYRQALQAANAALAQADLPRDQVETALFLRGAALYEQTRDPSQVVQAGWALARVLVEFPASRHTAECRYYLGLVHQRLGLPEPARQLLRQALQTPGAGEDLKERAGKALASVPGR